MRLPVDYKNLGTIRSAAALTTSYVAASTISDPPLFNQLVLLVSFTKATSTSMELKVEFSPDNTTFYQESVRRIRAGTATLREIEHAVVSANQSAATQTYRIPATITDRYIKVSVKATGVVANTSVSIVAILGVNPGGT